jgi:ankyrin repeat protein
VTNKRFSIFLSSLLVMGTAAACSPNRVDPATLNKQLIQAIQKGDVTSVAALLEKGASIEAKNYEDPHGGTALSIAADYGNETIIKLLISKGADPVAGGLKGQNALMDAAKSGKVKKVELILKGGVDQKIKNEALLAIGEHIGPTELDLPPEMAKEIERKEKIRRSQEPKPPVQDYAETTRILIKHGANIESRREDGATLLIMSASYGSTQVVKALLENHANIEAADNHGYTSLAGAACNCAIATMPSTYEVMELLVEKGANVNATANEGNTPLMLAAGWARTEHMRLLLDHDARVNMKNNKGDTALHILLSLRGFDTIKLIEMLLARGANPGIRNNAGDTPLSLAARLEGDERTKIIRLLRSKKLN